MPAARNVEYLIQRVRDEADEHDPARLLDGYAAMRPYYAPGTSILSMLNAVLLDLHETNFNKCLFTLTLQSGVSQYVLGRQVHDIESAYLSDTSNGTGPTGLGTVYSLYKTSLRDLDSAGINYWRGASNLRPTAYYCIGTRAVGFVPQPSYAGSNGLTVNYIATALVGDLVLPTDIPGQMRDSDGNLVIGTDGLPESALPEMYHELIAIGAAARICSASERMDRGARLQSEYERKKKLLKGLVEARQLGEYKALQLDRSGRYSISRGSTRRGFY